MKKAKHRILFGASALIVAIEITLGTLLQVASGDAVRYYSYAAVVLACLAAVMFAERSYSYLFVQLALVCTVGADYFLVLSAEQQQLPAMIFFSVTQLAYFARIYSEEKPSALRRWHVGVRIGACGAAVAATFLVLGERADAVAVVSMFYYANLIMNIVFAFLQAKRNWFFIIGLILFLLCDTVIGVVSMAPYLTIAKDSLFYRMISPGFNLAWAFYIPSQTLLVLSLFPKRVRTQ